MNEIIFDKGYEEMNQQQIMDEAYKRWQNNDWTKQQFWNRLSFVERVAVFTGNLNYQVENGGFMQWIDNAYSDCADQLVDFLLNEIATETAVEVARLVEEALERGFEECDLCTVGCGCYSCTDHCDCVCTCDYLNDLDTQYYALSEQFLADVEGWLATQ